MGNIFVFMDASLENAVFHIAKAKNATFSVALKVYCVMSPGGNATRPPNDSAGIWEIVCRVAQLSAFWELSLSNY